MKISEASYLFLSEQYSTVFDQVDYYVEDNESYSEPEDSEEKDNVSKKRHPSEKLKEKKNWTNIFTDSYDINVVKKSLFHYLLKHEEIKFFIKRNNNHMCQKTEYLNF